LRVKCEAFRALFLQEGTEKREASLWWDGDLGFFFLQEGTERREAFGKSGKRETGKAADGLENRKRAKAAKRHPIP
jgi:hypothetical protein